MYEAIGENALKTKKTTIINFRLMKWYYYKKAALLILINILPAILLFLHLLDIIAVLKGAGDYPFESAFFSPISIYQSKTLYLIYNIVFSLILIGLIATSIWKGHGKLYFILLAISMLLLIYPLLTNE